MRTGRGPRGREVAVTSLFRRRLGGKIEEKESPTQINDCHYARKNHGARRPSARGGSSLRASAERERKRDIRGNDGERAMLQDEFE